MDSNAKKVLWFTILVYLLMVAVSTRLLVLKREALQFHTRDYNYFIEQAARLTDPQMSKRFALNIEGYNFLGFRGVEGVKNLYHAIHAEYFRYTYVLLYAIFHSTLPIYIFYCLVFFLPILYFAFIAAVKGGAVWLQALLFCLLYALFPATPNAVVADLRPRILLSAAWCLAILAVYFDRPLPEKLLFFALLLGIREEGIVLGAFVIILNFLHLRGKPSRWKQALILLAMDIAALAAFLVFMAWGGFDRGGRFNPENLVNRMLGVFLPLTLGGALLAALLLWAFFKHRDQFNKLLILSVYFASILVSSVQLMRERWLAQNQEGALETPLLRTLLDVAANPLTGLPLYVSLLLLVLLLDVAANSHRKFLAAFLSLLCLVFAVATLATFPRQVATWQQDLPQARLVWDFVSSHNRLQTYVLLDYNTYQAFYNYENILVYNRLPAWLVSSEKRYYPENIPVLVRHIRRRMDYAVIAQDSLQNVLMLARLSGIPTIQLAANPSYVILKFGQ
jgi:hypothetical protein